MFSILFFLFVAVVVVIGIIGMIWRKRNKIPLESDELTERRKPVSRNGAFKETSTDDIKGGVVPADNKLSQTDFNEQREEQ